MSARARRFRITQTVVTEYEVLEDCYPACDSDLARLELDLNAVRNDPTLVLALGDVDPKIEVKGEIL